MKRLLPGTGIVLIFLTGLAILLYPSFSNWLNQRNTSRSILQYEKSIDTLPIHVKEEQLRLATEYNNALSGADIRDPFVPGSGIALPDDYTSVLNINGIMGYLEIPKIDVYLSIRHGTSDEALRQAVGHIEATAFPTGGEGNHCVLTAHRGLAAARLFTDLDQLENGDIFLLYVMEDILAYQVDQVLVVEPMQTGELRPTAGRDYVTLITCTPYAVNSHRLLVRGERVPYPMNELGENTLPKLEKKRIEWRGIIIIGFSVLWAVFLLAYAASERRENKRWKKR